MAAHWSNIAPIRAIAFSRSVYAAAPSRASNPTSHAGALKKSVGMVGPASMRRHIRRKIQRGTTIAHG